MQVKKIAGSKKMLGPKKVGSLKICVQNNLECTALTKLHNSLIAYLDIRRNQKLSNQKESYLLQQKKKNVC